MKAKILLVAVCVVTMAACTKDKFSTKPKLTFESVNGDAFAIGQTVIIKMHLTDKEGDFLVDESDPTYMKPYLFVKRFSYVCGNINTDTAGVSYLIPAFQSRKILDTDIDLRFSYGISDGIYPSLRGCDNTKDDSTYFQVWIKDEAGNVSDTINTATFKLLKQ